MDLTLKLLRFSSHEVVARGRVDLADLLSRLKPTISSIAGEHTRTTFRGDPGAVLEANAQQLEHLILELVLNARDAMPSGGELSISVGVVAQDDRSIVRMNISDTGHGMPPAVRARALEPFFTTKERGRGTGLGLATVVGIVKQLDGSIDISSSVDVGTTVTIDFPRAASLNQGCGPRC